MDFRNLVSWWTALRKKILLIKTDNNANCSSNECRIFPEWISLHSVLCQTKMNRLNTGHVFEKQAYLYSYSFPKMIFITYHQHHTRILLIEWMFSLWEGNEWRCRNQSFWRRELPIPKYMQILCRWQWSVYSEALTQAQYSFWLSFFLKSLT